MIGFCAWTYDKEGQCYHTGCNNTEIDMHDYIDKYCTCCGRRIYYPQVMFKFERKPIAYAN